ncbi:MAG TPA: hypothetical protein VMS55_03065 [Myxococcota bacterium]|nr:hypothetical protein [Myxococcota bacterium]
MMPDDIERRVLDHGMRADAAQVLATLALVREVRALREAVEELPDATDMSEHVEALCSAIGDAAGQVVGL